MAKTEKGGNNEPQQEILKQDRQAALFEAIACCRNVNEYRAFLADLCTPQEINALTERWQIARLLDQGDMSYRDISAATGASTTTVGRVARFLQQEPHKGYRLVLERIGGGQNGTGNNSKK